MGFGEDKMCWTPAKSRGFEVSSYHQTLLGVCTQSFPWTSIWKQKFPSKVTFFVWTIALGTILTIDNLHKKKVLILDWCYMCKSNGVLVDHILLHSPIVFELWSTVFTLFGTTRQCQRLWLSSLHVGKETLVIFFFFISNKEVY